MLSKTLAVLFTAALAAASPCKPPKPSGVDDTPAHEPTEAPVAPKLPVNGNGKELPGAPEGMKLKYITLGFGIQNYTCESVNATPKATGALAVLYDMTDYYPGMSTRSLSQHDFDHLGVDALHRYPVPLNMAKDAGESIAPGAVNPPFNSDAPLSVDGVELPFVGHHIFTAAGVPQFRFQDVNFLGKKLDETKAPEKADKGPDGTGTVAWLQLGATEGSSGAQLTYRVVTAGGVSHGCSKVGTDSTSYSTQYWFYG